MCMFLAGFMLPTFTLETSAKLERPHENGLGFLACLAVRQFGRAEPSSDKTKEK